MGTEILKSFGNLQSELEQAKSSLKGVDENIKRLIGRDPSELPPRPGVKRGVVPDEKNRQPRIVRSRNFTHENEEPPNKRRNNSGVSVFKRLSDRPIHHEEDHQVVQKQMISKVIVTPKEVPSRQDALAAQSKDEKSKARNRRMFGALLGTLQKFQQEETKLKQKEDKRAQLEKKIEEHEIKEKQEIKKERQELFLNRRKKQAEIKMIELKMIRMKEYALWEERQKPRSNFILTKAKPHIHFLPRRLNDANKALLENSKTEVEKIIERRREEVFNELKHIEERMRKNFENKAAGKGAKDSVEENNEGEADHDPDPDHQFEEDGDALMADLTEKDNHPTIEFPEEKQEVENSIELPEKTETSAIIEETVPEANGSCRVESQSTEEDNLTETKTEEPQLQVQASETRDSQSIQNDDSQSESINVPNESDIV